MIEINTLLEEVKKSCTSQPIDKILRLFYSKQGKLNSLNQEYRRHLEKISPIIENNIDYLRSKELHDIKEFLVDKTTQSTAKLFFIHPHDVSDAKTNYEKTFYNTFERKYHEQFIPRYLDYTQGKIEAFGHFEDNKSNPNYKHYQETCTLYNTQVQFLDPEHRKLLTSKLRDLFSTEIKNIFKVPEHDKKTFDAFDLLPQKLNKLSNMIQRVSGAPLLFKNTEFWHGQLAKFCKVIKSDFHLFSLQQKKGTLTILKQFKEQIGLYITGNSEKYFKSLFSEFKQPYSGFLEQEQSKFDPVTFKPISHLFEDTFNTRVLKKFADKLSDPKTPGTEKDDLIELYNTTPLKAHGNYILKQLVKKCEQSIMDLSADSSFNHEKCTNIEEQLFYMNEIGTPEFPLDTIYDLASTHWKPENVNTLIMQLASFVPEKNQDSINNSCSLITEHYLLSSTRTKLDIQQLENLIDNIKRLKINIHPKGFSGIDTYLNQLTENEVSTPYNLAQLMPLVVYDHYHKEQDPTHNLARLSRFTNYDSLLLADMNSEYKQKLIHALNIDAPLPDILLDDIFAEASKAFYLEDLERCELKLRYLKPFSYDFSHLHNKLLEKKSVSNLTIHHFYRALEKVGFKYTQNDILDHVFSDQNIFSPENQTPKEHLNIKQELFVELFKKRYINRHNESGNCIQIFENLSHFIDNKTVQSLTKFAASFCMEELHMHHTNKYNSLASPTLGEGALGVDFHLAPSYNKKNHRKLITFINKFDDHISLNEKDIDTLFSNEQFLLDPTVSHEKNIIAKFIRKKGYDSYLNDVVTKKFIDYTMANNFSYENIVTHIKQIEQNFQLENFGEHLHSKIYNDLESSFTGSTDKFAMYMNRYVTFFGSKNLQSFLSGVQQDLFTSNHYTIEEQAQIFVNIAEYLKVYRPEETLVESKCINSFLTSLYTLPAEQCTTILNTIFDKTSHLVDIYSTAKTIFEKHIVKKIKTNGINTLESYIPIASNLFPEKNFYTLTNFLREDIQYDTPPTSFGYFFPEYSSKKLLNIIAKPITTPQEKSKEISDYYKKVEFSPLTLQRFLKEEISSLSISVDQLHEPTNFMTPLSDSVHISYVIDLYNNARRTAGADETFTAIQLEYALQDKLSSYLLDAPEDQKAYLKQLYKYHHIPS